MEELKMIKVNQNLRQMQNSDKFGVKTKV